MTKDGTSLAVVERLSPFAGRLAQLEERLPYKEEVGGSSPSAPTSRPPGRAGVPTCARPQAQRCPVVPIPAVHSGEKVVPIAVGGSLARKLRTRVKRSPR